MSKYILKCSTNIVPFDNTIAIDNCNHRSVDKIQRKHRKGPFIYYVIKKVGGWVRPNAYVCLQGGWVGVAKCLRKYKNK